MSLDGWILGIITSPLLSFYTAPCSNLLRDYQDMCPAMYNHFMKNWAHTAIPDFIVTAQAWLKPKPQNISVPVRPHIYKLTDFD